MGEDDHGAMMGGGMMALMQGAGLHLGVARAVCRAARDYGRAGQADDRHLRQDHDPAECAAAVRPIADAIGVGVGRESQAIDRMEHAVKTIVEYTDRVPPANDYPHRLISTLASGPCCFSGM